MADQTDQPISEDHVFCAHCGIENAKSDYACNRCGERLIEVNTETGSPFGLVSCSRCGGANNTRAAYCWVCGTEMNDAVRISPAAQPSRQPGASSPPSAQTYRPDLNPVSVPSGEPNDDGPDLRGSSHTPGGVIEPSTGNAQFRDESEANNSGTKNAEVPPEIKKWNWAAFLVPAIWGLFSGVPITALLFGAVFLPPLIQYPVMIGASIFLGLRGNELAWRGKKWRSVRHFNAFQKQWGSWSIKFTAAVFALFIIYALIQSGG